MRRQCTPILAHTRSRTQPRFLPALPSWSRFRSTSFTGKDRRSESGPSSLKLSPATKSPRVAVAQRSKAGKNTYSRAATLGIKVAGTCLACGATRILAHVTVRYEGQNTCMMNRCSTNGTEHAIIHRMLHAASHQSTDMVMKTSTRMRPCNVLPAILVLGHLARVLRLPFHRYPT